MVDQEAAADTSKNRDGLGWRRIKSGTAAPGSAAEVGEVVAVKIKRSNVCIRAPCLR